jgi:short-subunit dehydrogenase
VEFKQKYGPWALVIGASEGLGAAFADNCAARGLNVAIAARRQSALDTVAASLRAKHGVETREIVADAGAPDFEQTIRKGVEGLEIGFMIFNAAAEPGGPFMKIALEDHMNNIQVNCIAPTRLTYWLGGEMIARKRGGIVLVSSTGAFTGLANWATYAAAKSYELILGEGLWDEFRDHGVLATSYLVGSTATPTFMRIQEKLDLPFKAGFDPDEFEDKSRLPRTPEEVAAALFPQLEDGPRLYCHPNEEALFKASAESVRKDWIAQAGEGTKTFFTGGLNELKA